MNLRCCTGGVPRRSCRRGLAWVFPVPDVSGEKKGRVGRDSVAAEPSPRVRRQGQFAGAEQVEGRLRELDARRQKEKTGFVPMRLTRLGVDGRRTSAGSISGVDRRRGLRRRPYVIGGAAGAAGMAFGRLGLPRVLALGYLKKRRETAVLKALPDASTSSVRGIQGHGLPCSKSIR